MGFAICNDMKDFSFLFFVYDIIFIRYHKEKIKLPFFLNIKDEGGKNLCIMNSRGFFFSKSHKNKSPYIGFIRNLPFKNEKLP